MGEGVSARRSQVDVWGQRSERAAAQWRSEAVWQSLGDDRRAAVLTAVGSQLEELLRTLHNWVPHSIDLRPTASGKDQTQVLSLAIDIELPAITNREAAQMTAAERERCRVVADLRDMAQDLTAGR